MVTAMLDDCLRVQIEQEGDEQVLTLSGDLDYGASMRIRQTFNALLAERPARLVVDVRNLEYLDSSGLNDLLYCYRNARNAGCAFTVRVEKDRPRRTSHLRQILAFLPVEELL